MRAFHLSPANEITVFAPTDAAIARIPADTLAALTGNPTELQKILGYHAVLEDVAGLHKDFINRLQDKVVMSSNNLPIRINVYKPVHSIAAEGVNITERAIRVSNGYVHAIDGVMMPPTGDVVEIAVADGSFTTLVSLLTSAGLVDAIKSDMNITVFAPNDAAFAKLNPPVTAYLVSHPEDLKNVLLYHVVEKTTLYSIGMLHTLTFHTADQNRDNLMVFEDFATGDIMVNTAKIIKKDISATNGVIHVIDEVLVPARVLLKIQEQGITIG
ncbi:hypothetical protein EGW08_008649 [Elysia chlorotica]|uniref:FAS1 domain-containing protein n=1 Tax=Elysia chlorotica TaxID=188477 RepID=A0A3S1BGR8_ELYCH|nr:hypothetical protein EGW08_008649 [Elysia chlorotica]